MARMGRPRQFDEDQVIDTAKEVFWRRGYTATSVGDLEDELGVLRGSLYGAFGDKHGLFLRALERYAADTRTVTFEGDGPVLPRVRRVLLAALDAATAQPGWGCLFGNTAAELLPADQQAAEIVACGYRDFERTLAEALTRARETGEVRADVQPAPVARMLGALMQGLHLLARTEADPQRLADAVDAALSGLTTGTMSGQ